MIIINHKRIAGVFLEENVHYKLHFVSLPIRDFRNERRTGPETRPAVASGIVTRARMCYT